MYVVIEFGGEDSNKTAVVRQEWLTPQKKEVFWPPFKLSSRFNKALTEGTCPPDENTWSLYSVKRCLYFCDNLLKARQKEREAETESDLVTELEDINEEKRRKRKIKRPQALVSSDSEDADTVTCHKKLKYPEAPSLTCNPVSSKDGWCSTPSNNGNVKLTSIDVDLCPEKTSSIASSEFSFMSRASAQTPIPSETLLDCTVANSGFTIVAQKLATLELQVVSIKQYLEDVLPKLTCRNEGEGISRDNLPPLPCHSNDDVTKLEEWLAANIENQQLLVQYLGRVGGRTVDYVLKKVLERLFNNEVAQLFNWTGKHNKLCLKGMKIIDVIYSVVRNNKGTVDATECEMEKTLRRWFRFAKDRDGGRENRRKKNTNNKDQ